MFFPTVKAKEKSRDMVQVFGGYNHNPRINDGEWYDTLNMSSKDYPLTSARPKRMKGVNTGAATGIAPGNMLAYVRGGSGRLYVNGESTQLTLDPTTPKQFVWMGAYLIVFPDGVWLNTADTEDYGHINVDYRSPANIGVRLVDERGNGIEIKYWTETQPANPEDGEYWINTKTRDISVWSESIGMWYPITNTYVQIIAQSIGNFFEVGDGIKISGFSDPLVDEKTGIISNLNGYNVIAAKETNSIVVSGAVYNKGKIGGVTNIMESIRVQREMPDMDYVCECNNRLWGCKYGPGPDGMINEIYCSKLGDFKNWRFYKGNSMDSWAASCGTQGPWTGCINYNNMPTFFKENFVHRVYVSHTGAHQITTQELRGVQDGSWRSLAVADEILYYLSKNGVMAYTGASLPACISDAFGSDRFVNGRAGVLDSMYFLTCEHANTGEQYTFVYDAKRQIWQRESPNGAKCYSRIGNGLYWQTAEGDIEATMYTEGEPAPGSYIDPTRAEEFEWMCETGDIGLTLPDNKYVSRLNIGYKSLEDGEEVRLWMMYDDSGIWEDKGTFRQDVRRTYGLGTITVPVIPVRCDHCRIRIAGSKDIKIYSISKIIEQGSDVL